ncbi:MAG: hypothetical protein LBS69_08225 [Prevotellaceae bacterium]|jgi:hypothetical protein|nr:hypothetical protein [Prevotellaceae bacterium]
MKAIILKTAAILLLLAGGFASCEEEERNKDNTCLLLDNIEILYSDIPPALYRDLVFIDDTTGYAISEGYVVKTTDGGKCWNSQSLPINTNVGKIQFTDENTGYITGGDNTFGVLFKTIDGGARWNTIYLNSLEIPSGMFFINNDTGFITGKGLFAKTTDGGKNWIDLKTEDIFMYNDVKFKNTKDGTVTSMNGVYLQTSDGGETWNSFKYNTTDHLYNIYFADNATYVTSNASSILLDLDNNKEIISLKGSTQKFVFFDSKKSIAVSHYWEGEVPNGILFITANSWKTYCSKELSMVASSVFAAITKMSESKAMILCKRFHTTEVMIINF